MLWPRHTFQEYLKETHSCSNQTHGRGCLCPDRPSSIFMLHNLGCSFCFVSKLWLLGSAPINLEWNEVSATSIWKRNSFAFSIWFDTIKYLWFLWHLQAPSLPSILSVGTKCSLWGKYFSSIRDKPRMTTFSEPSCSLSTGSPAKCLVLLWRLSWVSSLLYQLLPLLQSSEDLLSLLIFFSLGVLTISNNGYFRDSLFFRSPWSG